MLNATHFWSHAQLVFMASFPIIRSSFIAKLTWCQMENKLVWAEYLVDHLITLGKELEKLLKFGGVLWSFHLRQSAMVWLLLYWYYIRCVSFGVISENFHFTGLWSNDTQGCYNYCRPESLSKSWKKTYALVATQRSVTEVLYFIGIKSIIIIIIYGFFLF